jgi:hypothetical protein
MTIDGTAPDSSPHLKFVMTGKQMRANLDSQLRSD